MKYGVVNSSKNISIYENYEEAKRWYNSCIIIYKDVYIYELKEVQEYTFTHSLGAKAN